MANTVSQPDGSSASPLNPPAPAVADASSWTERYSVDWSAESAHDWTANASPHDVAGAAWGAVNAANASAFEINGSGLQMSPDSGTSSYWFSAQNCPRLYCSVKGPSSTPIYPNASNLQAIAFQALISGDADQDYNGYGMHLGAAATFAASIERHYSSAIWGGSNKGYRVSNSPGTGWTALNSSEMAGTFSLFEIVAFPSGTLVCSVRDEVDFVDPLGASEWRSQVASNSYRGTTDASNTWLPSNMWIQFIAYNGAANTHTMTVDKFRVVTLGAE